MVLSDERPQKPRRFDAPGITAEVWNISEWCWHRGTIDRPRVKDVLGDLEGVASSGKHAREACPVRYRSSFYNRNRWRTVHVGAKVTNIQMSAIYAGDQHFPLSTRLSFDVRCAKYTKGVITGQIGHITALPSPNLHLLRREKGEQDRLPSPIRSCSYLFVHFPFRQLPSSSLSSDLDKLVVVQEPQSRFHHLLSHAPSPPALQ